MNVTRLARRILAAERRLVGRGLLERWHDPPHRILAKAGADHSDEDEMIAAIDARHQRAELAVGRLPSAEHDYLSRARLGFGPALRTSAAVWRAELLGDDPFKRQFRRRFQHGIAIALKVFDIADRSGPLLDPPPLAREGRLRLEQFL